MCSVPGEEDLYQIIVVGLASYIRAIHSLVIYILPTCICIYESSNQHSPIKWQWAMVAGQGAMVDDDGREH